MKIEPDQIPDASDVSDAIRAIARTHYHHGTKSRAFAAAIEHWLETHYHATPAEQELVVMVAWAAMDWEEEVDSNRR